jgi:putative ABC transport system permease protein
MFRRLRRRWRALWRRDELERELDEELRFHVERETEKNLARGMNDEEARRAALVTFGGVARTRQECRDARGVRVVEEIAQDLRFGWRMLRAQPGLSLIAILTLALGIGANTAVFSVVNAVLLRPLGHPDPDQLVRVHLFDPKATSEPERRSVLGDADFLALRERNRSFAAVAALQVRSNGFSFVGGGGPEQVGGALVSADFFEVLRAPPFRGRTFARGEDRAGGPRVAVIGHGFWQERLGGDAGALGRVISLEGDPYTVIGIMPAGFRTALTPGAQVWAAMQFGPPAARPPYYLRCIGRLRPGVSQQQAAADAGAIARRVGEQFASPQYAAYDVEPLVRSIVGESQRALLVLFGAVLSVLLIASVNLANLLLARGTSRQRELAVRAALGASRWRIVRQLSTESALLASLGGALGLLLAVWGVRFVPLVAPAGMPRVEEIGIDAWVLGFTVIVSAVSGLVFGLAPALQLSRLDLGETIKEAGGAGGHSGARHRLRSLLVIAEVALAFVLLTGAGLLVRSFVKLQHVDPGFDPHGVLTMVVNAQENRYPKEEQLGQLQGQLLAAVRSLPGVQSAGLSMGLPPNLLIMTNPFTVEGRVPSPGDTQPLAEQLLVTPDYFRTLGIRLRAGRAFTDADRAGAPGVLVINQAMARRYFRGVDPIGRRLQTGGYDPRNPWLTVVGVVDDVKYQGLHAETEPTIYVPFAQHLWWRSMDVAVRAQGDPLAIAAAVQDRIRSVDADIPIWKVRTMEQVMSESLARPRVYTVLLGVFGAVALILAAIGVYGVMAYTVRTRTREIGIRMALGARVGDVLRMVIAGGMKLAAIGGAIGLLGSVALNRLLEGLLFGVSPLDPTTLVGTGALLAAVMLLACAIPARRVARTDPSLSLRHE